MFLHIIPCVLFVYRIGFNPMGFVVNLGIINSSFGPEFQGKLAT